MGIGLMYFRRRLWRSLLRKHWEVNKAMQGLAMKRGRRKALWERACEQIPEEITGLSSSCRRVGLSS